MTARVPIKVDIWSDIVCPWCYIGKRRFEEGLREWGGAVEVEYHSFDLLPDTPEDFGGTPIDYLVEVRGMDRDAAVGMVVQEQAVARSVGLEFDYANAHHARTAKAHRLLHFAKAHGKQLEVAEGLFDAYFVTRSDIGDTENLARIAEAAGLDHRSARTAVEEDSFDKAVQEDLKAAAAYGIRGVPFFVLDGKYGISGAQAPQVFADALARVASERSEDRT
ncbi:DsbA family protein [Streptomyces fuscichromogenes]|uniref:DsbA family oxidoreductase n=1 Tax=Streptomyces fuscichromogenes TaxID=1324013 RepID=UPI0037F2D177